MAHWLSRGLCRPKAKQNFSVDGQDYVLAGSIGDGAAGLVRKAKSVSNDTMLAVKLLAPDPKYIDESVFDDVASRFRREGNRGAQLENPHLIEVHSYSENADGCCFANGHPKNPFILMEYIGGRTLEQYIRKEPIENRGVFEITQPKLHIAIQTATALEHLHKQKLTHRDVKPANIFLSKRTNRDKFPFVKLGDFGVMKWGDFHASVATGTLTATFQRGLGTMKYMSPEQAITPKTVTVRSDIFSLGITLFELFTSQILASSHHVNEIVIARLSRNTIWGKFNNMNYELNSNDERLAELLLDTFLRGSKGRPSAEKIRGNLEWEYENRYETSWRDDLY